MNAVELAEELSTCRHPAYIGLLLCRKASEALRRQHEAIVKLRGALQEISDNVSGDGDNWCGVIAEQALKDTEEFK